MRFSSYGFIALHILVIAVFFVEFTWLSFWLCVGFYYLRMLGIATVYHRQLSHAAYYSTRWVRFILAFLACAAFQKGPLWWAARHRDHHKYTDTPQDPHTPVPLSWWNFWHAHVGWILSKEAGTKDLSNVKDLVNDWELRLLNKFHWIPGILLATLCFIIDSWSGLVWGFLVSTVALYHGTFLVNSICHVHIPWFTRRRFDTKDNSQNVPLVAMVITLGEGWHNNHHYRQGSERQGIRWWEIDVAHYFLWFLSLFGLVWGLHKTPKNRNKK